MLIIVWNGDLFKVFFSAEESVNNEYQSLRRERESLKKERYIMEKNEVKVRRKLSERSFWQIGRRLRETEQNNRCRFCQRSVFRK